VNQKDPSEIERSKATPDSTGTGAGPGQPDDDSGSITSGSPMNLLLVAIVVALLTFAGVVFYIAWQWEDIGSASGKWRVAYSILSFTATGVFYSGTLVGLGTVATTRPSDVSRRPTAIASLLSKAGAAVIILGVAAAVCTIAANDWEGWRGVASMVAMDMAYRIFGAGVLAGLALLCLRQAKPGGSRDKET
jgi:hypothetical protein